MNRAIKVVVGSRERWVVNLTNAQLSKSEVEVLEKGLSFAPAPNKLLTTHLIAAAEKGLSKLQSNVASDARKRIASLLSRSKPPPSNLTPEQKRAIKSLGARDDILILPADKGRATVVMARDDYLNKMNAMLSDDKTYQPVEKDPTPHLNGRRAPLLRTCITFYARLGAAPHCCMASLRYISLMYHCVLLSPLCNPLRTSSQSI